MSGITCPSCQRNIHKNSRLCPHCGAEIPSEGRVAGEANAGRQSAAFWGITVLLPAIGAAWAFHTAGSAEISKSTAVIICGNAFEKAAASETDFTFMSVVLWDLWDSWLVKFPAKVRAASVAWDGVVVHCRCLKENPDPRNEFNSDALVEFEIIPKP